ncbi:hypothetical protein CF67_04180 [Candidatus Photodesmus blepharus]|uniref:Na+/H+ antiporter NhaC-like C-terminal domain-containing protein n=1 Tax=Candidatus Photodesmus blepharonis TaxID=1179155 RepID=A0A084CMY6_9GAMM|nr:Na+/H+ antiporter NhaC family protein [Candidatus Photodesmus blepharus]KEY91165.1 hypothetical protein CF67_04180 [Candidatus Photodesmus blepharus]
MNLVDFTSSSLSLLPPITVLGLAIVTRRILTSLGIGILLGSILLNDYVLEKSLNYANITILNVFVVNGEVNSWNMSILGFLLLLGAMNALLTLSGGSHAFANWAQIRIKSKRGSKLLATFLGLFIFVDDYFNSLAVGSVSRPITDRFYVSRAKLAYILDSTAAPVCVIIPISSWGAYAMTIVSGILASHNIIEYSPLNAYLCLIPMNFYAIFSLLMVFAVVCFQLDIGQMRQHEIDASEGRGFHNYEENQFQKMNPKSDLAESNQGKASDLLIPIVFLIVTTISTMLYTGQESLTKDGKEFEIFKAFENANMAISLINGALIGTSLALLSVVKQRVPLHHILRTVCYGIKSMLGATLILIFSWTIGIIINDMKTGIYLSSLVSQVNINVHYLPVILFLLSGLIAFSTGTSWGTFGIMLPISGDIANATDITLILPMLSAVLAGAVFGDHCSPISDTTILSSIGAKCSHIDHVSTQLPYSLSVALVSSIGFLVLGITTSVFLSISITFAAFIIVCLIFSILAKSKIVNLRNRRE